MFSLGASPLNQTDPCGGSVRSNSLVFQSVFLPVFVVVVLLAAIQELIHSALAILVTDIMSCLLLGNTGTLLKP